MCGGNTEKKEILGENIRWKPCKKLCILLYAVCVAFLVIAIVCLLLPTCVDEQWNCAFVIYLKKVIDKTGIKAVISAIGIYAVAFAWLVSIQSQKVYGVTIGTLLRWAYPGFYFFYFVVFIGTDLVGLYACSIPGRRIATGLAMLGILIGMIYSIWVCYKFVLDFHTRQRIAESYHYAQINLQKLKKNTNGEIQGSLKCKIKESIALIGRTVAEQEKNGEWIHVSAVFDLWCAAYSNYKNLISDAELQSEEKNELCYLGEQFWSNALPKDLSFGLQVKLTGLILSEFRNRYEEEHREVLYCFLAGLLLCLGDDEEGLECGRLKSILPKIIWEEVHWIKINEMRIDLYLYECLILGYIWMSAMIGGRIAPSLWDFLTKTEFIVTSSTGIKIKSNTIQIEEFLIIIDNAFAECKGFRKEKWMVKNENEDLFGEILKVVNQLLVKTTS